ncbi:MAG: hypothetical protein ACQR33_03885 [Candidatus Saccharibacteria bacterium]
MKHKALLILSIVTLGIVGLMAFSHPASSFASAQSDVCGGAALAGGSCTSDTTSLTTTIRNIINLFSIIVGIVAVIVVIVAGFRYVTSGGDSSKISGAKNTLIYAIVGLVIVALSQAIVQFVLSKTQ